MANEFGNWIKLHNFTARCVYNYVYVNQIIYSNTVFKSIWICGCVSKVADASFPENVWFVDKKLAD